MRKNLLCALILSGLLTVGTTVSAQSLESKLKKTSKNTTSNARVAADVTVTLPTLETNYYFNPETETWIAGAYTANEYDAKGNLIMEAYFQTLGGDTLSKTIYEYDSKGNEIAYYRYSKDSNTNKLVLQSGNKTEYTIDANGRLTEEVYSEYNNSAWQFREKTVYGYTGSAVAPNLITRFEWDETAWVESETFTNITWYDFTEFEVKSYTTEYIEDDDNNALYRETYTSTYPGVGVELVEKKVGEVWVPVERYTDSVDPQGNIISLDEEYIENAWVILERRIRSVDVQGNRTFLVQDYIDNAWVNNQKEIELVDEMGSYAGYEEYNWVTNAWVLERSSTYENTYNGSGVLIEQVSTSTSSTNTYVSKTVFSEFETFTITSTSNAIASLELKAFPNPVNDVLNISIPNHETAEVRVYNMQNTLVQSFNIESGNTTVNVSNLSAGVYMLQVQTASGTQKSERIVKK